MNRGKAFITTGMDGITIEVKPEKYKGKTRVYKPGEISDAYILARDELWLNDLFTPQEIKDNIINKRKRKIKDEQNKLDKQLRADGRKKQTNT